VSATFTDDFVNIYHGDSWDLAANLDRMEVRQ